MPAATVCLHGDTPGAVAMALTVRRELEAHGIRVVAPGGFA
jgi:lactam utilization protein B